MSALIGVLSMAVVLVFVADALASYRGTQLPFPIPVVFGVVLVGRAAATTARW